MVKLSSAKKKQLATEARRPGRVDDKGKLNPHKKRQGPSSAPAR